MKPHIRWRPQLMFGVELDCWDLYLHLGPLQLWWELP